MPSYMWACFIGTKENGLKTTLCGGLDGAIPELDAVQRKQREKAKLWEAQ